MRRTRTRSRSPTSPRCGSDHDRIRRRTVRADIRTRLDATLIVEAAAGTGKTTELVKRIIAVLSPPAAPRSTASSP